MPDKYVIGDAVLLHGNGGKMKILTAYATDAGNVKPVNQDALLIKTARAEGLDIMLLGICDGMGGLSMGERASAHVIYCFSEWFEAHLAEVIAEEARTDMIREQWVELLEHANQKLAEFGNAGGLNLGTTCTVMLVLGQTYYIIHVGDSRVYEITESIRRLTNDQTVLAREIAMGRVKEEETAEDARGSVLLQCIGASKNIDPQFLTGEVRENAVYMLCSDGFRHKVTEEEFRRGFAPEDMTDERKMERQCNYFIELNKSRSERDNITVLLAKLQG